jgi:hypothetical protein
LNGWFNEPFILGAREIASVGMAIWIIAGIAFIRYR